MAYNDDAERTAAELADENDRLVLVTDWRVGSDGRLHIPKTKREKYDIEEGDDLDAVLVVGED